jgi:Inner membrane protein YgaP-like, transmembrane domain
MNLHSRLAMKKNMSGLDRTLRLLIAIGISILWYNGTIGGWLATILVVVAIAFFATSLMGWCPMYGPLRWSTRRVQ